ncbi:MAG: AMP-binding protein, partial [Terriglobia bacterium]
LFLGLPMAALSPLAFLRRPQRWLEAIHRHRGTLSPAPNFAYELCGRKIDGRVLDELDLSSWRVALNGAEPVSPDTLERFARRFARCGFRAQTMMPVYGLAETTVALTFAPLNHPPRIDRVARDSFQQRRRAQPAAASEREPLRFVSVGRALPEHEVRIVHEDGRPVGERIEGQIEFRGPSTMQSYYRNPQATADACTPDGWMRTGDLGYWAQGELFITGRTKDVVIKAGCNYYPHEIEEVAADAAGVRRGCVVAFSVPDDKTGTEALVVVAETRASDRTAQASIRSEIKRRIASACCIAPDVVELLRPQTIPKTPSGKLRRSATRQLYLARRLTARRAPAWWQATRLVAGTVMARLKRGASPNRPRPLP